jgi:glutaredoxin-like protein NrdH
MTTYPVTVYTTGPECGQCAMTKTQLDRRGIDYREVHIRQSPAAEEYVRTLGATGAPVVVVEDGTEGNYWWGFRPDRIAQLTDAYSPVAP